MNTDGSLIGKWAVNLQGRLAQITGYGKHPNGEVHVIGTGIDDRPWESQAADVLSMSDSIKLSETFNRRLPNA